MHWSSYLDPNEGQYLERPVSCNPAMYDIVLLPISHKMTDWLRVNATIAGHYTVGNSHLMHHLDSACHPK